MAENEEELKSLLINVNKESERADLEHNINKTKIMASGPNTSWPIYGEKNETVADFIFWHSKITGDGDCSREIKRCLLCIYWDNQMAFTFSVCNVVNYIDRFADIEESLHPWDKAHLVQS